MAGFLRRKTKQAPPQQLPSVPSKDVPGYDSSPPAVATPLFARFATTALNSNSSNAPTISPSTGKDGITPRMVSGPMQLSSRKDRDPRLVGGSVKGGGHHAHAHSTTSLTAGSRDAELAARSRRMQAQVLPQEKARGYGPGLDLVAGFAAAGWEEREREKPLPPPAPPAGEKPLGVSAPRKLSNASRGGTIPLVQPGPPPVSQNQSRQQIQSQSVRPRQSMDFENKPLPSPLLHQNAHTTTSTPPSSSSVYPTPGPPIRKRTGSSSGSTSTSRAANVIQDSRYDLPRPDYGVGPTSNANTNGNANANMNMNMNITKANGPNSGLGLGAATATATPASDRAVELPAEFALFQEYTDTISIPSAPSSLNSRQPKQQPGAELKPKPNPNPNPNPNPIRHAATNPVEHIPRSSVYIENSKPQPQLPTASVANAAPAPAPVPIPSSPPQLQLPLPPQQSQSQPQLPQVRPDKPQPPSPPLPPPPSSSSSHSLPSPPESQPDMGASASHMGPTAVLPPPAIVKDFYPAHVLHQPSLPAIQQQRTYQGPARSNSRSQSPPLPPGAAQPLNFASLNGHGKQHQQHQQPVQQRPQTQPQSYAQAPPLHQQRPQGQGQTSSPPRPLSQYQFSPPPQSAQALPQTGPGPNGAALRKAPSMQQAASPLLRGKPKIFAAMEAQGEIDGMGAEATRPGFEQAQAGPYRRQSQYGTPQSMYPPQTLGQPLPAQQQPPRPQGFDQQIPARVPLQQQPPPPLLPAVEFFTPKSRVEPLPNELIPEIPNEDSPPSLPTQRRALPPSPPRFPPVGQEQPMPDPVLRTPRSIAPQTLPRQDSSSSADTKLQHPPTAPSTPAPQRSRKLSKARPHAEGATHHPNGSSVTLQSSADSQHHRVQRSISKPLPSPMSPPPPPAPEPEPVQLDEETKRKAGIPLDDDPFARVEGVRMLKPTTPPPLLRPSSSKGHKAKESLKGPSSVSVDSVSGAEDSAGGVNTMEDALNGSHDDVNGVQVAKAQSEANVQTPLTPVSPEEYKQSRKDKKSTKSKAKGARPAPTTVEDAIAQVQAQAKPRSEPYTLMQFLSDPHFLSILLSFFSFYDWCILSSISKEIRIKLVRTPELREVVLESYLKTVGYSRWTWDDQEPLSLSLQDLSDYMRGVSIPTHEYARVASMYVHSTSIHPNHRDPSLGDTLHAMRASTRAYTRVILRLRAQAEKAEKEASLTHSPQPPPPSKSAAYSSSSRPGTASRVSSRAPSPTTSVYSHSHSAHGHVYGQVPGTPGSIQPSSSQTSFTFRSPLFKLRRAPLLRVFVPSPEGDWLSDKSVLECEAECKRAGVQHLMRLGDVVWDVAVGDEGNVGRLVWDGSYLIDLDYTYSSVGDLPKYLPTLAFPPSYFHRVVRTGANMSNPIAHIDISPWGEEIAMNLQLLQDRVRTETPQGAYHNVVRWVHRSSFTIRPSRGGQRYPNGTRVPPSNGRIPIPESNSLFVDPGWYGTIIVETEGTNEALADLQDRCGPGAFPPRPRGLNGQISQAQIENRKVFRILRERSRPGEIWIRAVSVKERLQ